MLAKSRALVAYVDVFVLEDEADKVTYVRAQSDYDKKRGDDRNDYYDYLCYATGLLNTILTECKWKKMPKKITKGRECHAMGVAIDAFNDLDDVLIEEADQKSNNNNIKHFEHVL